MPKWNDASHHGLGGELLGGSPPHTCDNTALGANCLRLEPWSTLLMQHEAWMAFIHCAMLKWNDPSHHGLGGELFGLLSQCIGNTTHNIAFIANLRKCRAIKAWLGVDVAWKVFPHPSMPNWSAGSHHGLEARIFNHPRTYAVLGEEVCTMCTVSSTIEPSSWGDNTWLTLAMGPSLQEA